MRKNDIAAFLNDVDIFQDLNRQEIERVRDATILRFIPKKGIIFTEGSEKETVYFIFQGLVKTYKTDENGHEQIVSFLKEGDMFPLTGFFNQSPYPATSEAIVDTQLLAIPVKIFEQLIMNIPSLAIKMIQLMGKIITELQEKIQVISGKDVKQRALSFLLILADQHGIRKQQKVIIDMPMTHQEFASSVGTTRETINRLLSQLVKENILEMDRNQIMIKNEKGLKELLE